MENVFVCFWKPNSLFSKFCVNCLLIFHFLYCIHCVLNDVNGACWCTCSLVALGVPEMCFWPAKTRKSLELLRCILVFDLILKYGSDVNEEIGYTFFFTSLYWWVKLPPFLEWVFSSCVPGFRLKFSRIAIWRKPLQFDSKSYLATNGLVLRFFVGKWLPSLTFYLYELKSAWIAQFLFFFDDINFFDV